MDDDDLRSALRDLLDQPAAAPPGEQAAMGRARHRVHRRTASVALAACSALILATATFSVSLRQGDDRGQLAVGGPTARATRTFRVDVAGRTVTLTVTPQTGCVDPVRVTADLGDGSPVVDGGVVEGAPAPQTIFLSTLPADASHPATSYAVLTVPGGVATATLGLGTDATTFVPESGDASDGGPPTAVPSPTSTATTAAGAGPSSTTIASSTGPAGPGEVEATADDGLVVLAWPAGLPPSTITLRDAGGATVGAPYGTPQTTPCPNVAAPTTTAGAQAQPGTATTAAASPSTTAPAPTNAPATAAPTTGDARPTMPLVRSRTTAEGWAWPPSCCRSNRSAQGRPATPLDGGSRG